MISKVSNFYNSIFVVFTSQIIFNSDLFQNLISKVPIFVIYLFIYFHPELSNNYSKSPFSLKINF